MFRKKEERSARVRFNTETQRFFWAFWRAFWIIRQLTATAAVNENVIVNVTELVVVPVSVNATELVVVTSDAILLLVRSSAVRSPQF